MTRFAIASMKTTLFASVAAVLVSLGCASTPRPKALEDASAQLTHQDVAELEGMTPDLVREAKSYLRKANEAYEDGDRENAELYAHLALLRLQTARNEVAAQSARKLAKLMGARNRGFGSEADRARARQAELRRFGQLEKRINELHDELNRKPEGDAPEVVAAKQALARARRKQAEAIGAGAAGLPEYQQGASLVSSAVESLEMGIYSESQLSSARALSAFEAAIGKAGAPKADTEAADAAARDRAEDALSEASSAQAMAIAAGAPQQNPAVYQRAASLLGAAERRFDRDDFRGTVRLAREAKQAFTDATALPAAGEAAMALGAGPSGGGLYGRSTDEMLIELRMKRAELLGAQKNESCPGVWKEFEAVLELAEERAKAGDERRAREFAIRAEERIKRCESASATATVVGPSESDIAEGIAKKRAAEAIRNAEGELARAQGKLGMDGRLVQPKTLIATAERWFDRGDFPQAERMADQARVALAAILASPAEVSQPAPEPVADPLRDEAAQLIERAQSLHATLVARLGDDRRLREPERQLREAERWFDRSRFAQAKQAAAKVLEQLTKLDIEPAKPATTPPAALSPEAQRAADAIEAARDAKVRAVVALVGEDELSKPDRLLELAQTSFDQKRYVPARTYADRARQEYLKLVEKTGKPAAPTEPAANTCERARDHLDTAERLARRTAGKHLSRSDQELHARGSSLATVGRLKLRDHECDEALQLADDAVDALQSLPRAPDTEKPGKTKPGKTKPGKTKPGKTKPGEPVAPWRTAYEKTMDALRARDAAREVVTSSTRRTFNRGVERLAEGRAAYDAKQYREAGLHADAALAQFEAVLAAAGEPLPEPVASTRRTPRRGAEETEAPASRTARTRPTKSRKPSADTAWKGPYRAVFEALALRDKAEAAAKSEAEKEAVARGKAQLDRAETAWDRKSFEAAGELAKLAAAEFDKVLDGSLAEPEDPAVAMRKADAALREARVVMQVCERDKCEERDFAELTRAKEMLKSAEESFEKKDYAYATELAKKAKDKLSLILTKPRPSAPKVKRDPALEQKVEKAVSEAEIAGKLCESRDCSKINLEGWLRAQQSLAAAKSALADGQLDRALRLAELAQEGYGAIQPTAPAGPSFTIPEGITSVTRSGSQLYLSPPVDFPSGTSTLQQGSRAVVSDLAKVLLANRDALQSVELIGYTDSSGNAVVNKNLSGRRADAVRKALEQAGVPGSLLHSEGRGADNPIADNATPEGRQANRRVEIHFQTK